MRMISGAFAFLTDTGCAKQCKELLLALQEVDPDLNTGLVEISWQTADKLINFDFSQVALTEEEPEFMYRFNDDVVWVDAAGLVIQLFTTWQDVYRLLNSVRDPTRNVVLSVEQGCRVLRECIAPMIPHGFNPTVWVHVICYHIPQHRDRFGNLRQFGLWGHVVAQYPLRVTFGPKGGSICFFLLSSEFVGSS